MPTLVAIIFKMATICVNGAAVVTKDERCILYTSAVDDAHKYVRVSCKDRAAFCLLRHQEVIGSVASFGLVEALQLSENRENLQVEPATHDNNLTGAATCKCKCGIITGIRVRFLDRTRPSGAVLRGLQHIASRLFDGAIVWKGRRSSVSWLGIKDAIQFVDLQWGEVGLGCCEQLGMITSASRVELSFHGEKRPGATQFKTSELYVKQIASELGGVDKYSRRLLRTIRLHFESEQIGHATAKPSVGAIISGLPGIGKTALAKAICKKLGVSSIFLDAADIFQTHVGESEKQLVQVFDSAISQAPSILIIDGIEAIAGNRRALANSQSALEFGVLNVLLSFLEKLKSSHQKIFVLGTTSRAEDVDSAIISNRRLDQVVYIAPPTQIERFEILQILTNAWKGGLDIKFLNQLSERTGGFVGADLLSLCQKAFQVCLNESTKSKAEDNFTVCPRHFEQALAVTFPSVLQAHYLLQKQQQPISTSLQNYGDAVSEGVFSCVYGMNDAVQNLRVSLIDPLVDCSRFLKFGTMPPKGVLLIGPPGSGKTYLANAVAKEVRRLGLASFVSVQCSDLLTKIVGDTEKALHDLFVTARNAAPCVLYFDHIESIAPLRGFDTSTEQTFDRMLSMLLVEMDGFNSSRLELQRSLASDEARTAFLKEHVVILASTTNRKSLDPSILRPGLVF